MRYDVVVVGSLNQDITVRVPHLPSPGETVLGGDAVVGGGGKGANQAVAAARLGAVTAMVGRVGDDGAGAFLRERLVAEGIEVQHLAIDPERATGTALITVDTDAENAIVVSPGANHAMTPADVEQAEDVIAMGRVVLLQLEVPLDVVAAAAAAARGLVVLNPAPAARLSPEVLSAVDVLVPNEGELGVLAGVERGVEEAARSLAVGRDVVVTLGSTGALAVTRHGAEHLAPAPRVAAVDTVGAGDCFCGALGVGLAEGMDMEEAMRFATHAAAVAVTRFGAQDAMPTRAEVMALLGGT